MQIDLEYLRQHYASLSDEALAEINRGELVQAAQKCYDDERARRVPSPQQNARNLSKPEVKAAAPDRAADDQDAPGWIEDASCVYSIADYPGTQNSVDAANAQDVLQAAGIPAYVAVEEIQSETPGARPQFEYRVLVPGALNLKAASILDKEIFNAGLEADWKAHFEALSDEELRELSPEVTCAGWADRIERLTRVYKEELARRESA